MSPLERMDTQEDLTAVRPLAQTHSVCDCVGHNN